MIRLLVLTWLARRLDARLKDERFQAQWHVWLAAFAGMHALTQVAEAGFHFWAAQRHTKALKTGQPSPCKHR